MMLADMMGPEPNWPKHLLGRVLITPAVPMSASLGYNRHPEATLNPSKMTQLRHRYLGTSLLDVLYDDLIPSDAFWS
jgi:hypothetical protein